MHDITNKERIFLVFLIKKEIKDLLELGHTMQSPYVIALRKILLKLEGVAVL